jgi:hypothetical protein
VINFPSKRPEHVKQVKDSAIRKGSDDISSSEGGLGQNREREGGTEPNKKNTRTKIPEHLRTQAI